ncbi:MAG: nuclear transport factor 2 family protein [Burkholderiaceae bacterium]
MPMPQRLEAFIARVEENKHVEAIEEFYTASASMQENMGEPRRGRDVLMAREAKVMARAATLRSTCVRPAFVNGDHVVVRWVFEFDWLDGTSSRMEELAWQRWEGDRIAQETFFYDPAQRSSAKPA